MSEKIGEKQLSEAELAVEIQREFHAHIDHGSFPIHYFVGKNGEVQFSCEGEVEDSREAVRWIAWSIYGDLELACKDGRIDLRPNKGQGIDLKSIEFSQYYEVLDDVKPESRRRLEALLIALRMHQGNLVSTKK
jgi:hypothetical protein